MALHTFPGPDDWARSRVQRADDALLDPLAARRDYLMWQSDLGPGHRRADQAAVNRALAGAGGRRRFVTEDGRRRLMFAGIELAPSPWPIAHRMVRGAPTRADADRVESALLALHAAGLVTSTRALDIAWLRLTGSSGASLCRVCGVITRRAGSMHVRCARRRRAKRHGSRSGRATNK